MQYNILHQKAGWGANAFLDLGLAVRADNVERAIRENAPDILVLAERHDEWAGIPVPYSETSVDLSLRLDDLYRFAEDRIENGTTVNRTPIAYRKDVFQCLESGSVELGEEIPFATSQNKRVVSYAVLEDISQTGSCGMRMVVFATHWSSGQPQECVNAQSERMQSVIRTVLSKADYATLPIIAAADFNVLYENEAYQALLSGCGLADADSTLHAPAGPDMTIVDHIATRNCKVVGFLKFTADYTQQASDHKPIVCEIQIGGI